MIKHLLITSVLTNVQPAFSDYVADKLDASIFSNTAYDIVVTVSLDVHNFVWRSVNSVDSGVRSVHASIIIKSYDT